MITDRMANDIIADFAFITDERTFVKRKFVNRSDVESIKIARHLVDQDIAYDILKVLEEDINHYFVFIINPRPYTDLYPYLQFINPDSYIL